MNNFRLSPRQIRTLVFLFIAILISFAITYLTQTTFGVFILTEVLVSGALVYSNEGFLRYSLGRSMLLTYSILAVILLLSTYVDMFFLINPFLSDALWCYPLVTVLLLATQKQVKVGPVQLLLGAVLILVFQLIHEKTTYRFNQENYVSYIPFFIGQLFISIYAVSMMSGISREENNETSLIGANESYTILPAKKPFKFLKFIIIALLGVGVLILIFTITLVGLWGGFTHPRDEMIKDYESNSGEFYDIQNKVNRLDPEHKISELEFDVHPEYKTFYITINGQDATRGSSNFQSWVPSDSLLKATPWTKENFMALQEKLNQINCDYIKTGDPFVIGHKPINGQRLFYNLFDYAADHFPYNDTCRFFRYNDYLILEFKHISQYDSDCFPN
jgi:hypothetical protein